MRELGQLCLWAGIFATIPRQLGEMMARVLRDGGEESTGIDGTRGSVFVLGRGVPGVGADEIGMQAYFNGMWVLSCRGQIVLPRDVAAVYSDMLLEGRRP
jgi:hypothetical protein